MASLETVAAPGSPPELSHSLSSKKSSSYNSSSLSDSAPHELAHFEDISLDDLPNAVANDVFANKNSYVRRQSSNGSLKRGLVSTSSANKEGSRNGGSARQQHPPLRLLTDTSNGKRITSSTMKPRPQPTKSNTTARPSPFGTPSPRKRVPSSPNPYLPSLIPPGKRSRSISPSPTQPFNTSPQSLYSPNLSTRRPSASGGGALAAFRRSSWQPGNRAGRKTVKELEDEYDDNDEELPEDAVVWNVPLSPRPPHDRSDRESSPSKSEISAPSPRDSGMSMTRTSSDISAAIATGTPAGLGLSMPSKVPPQPQPQPGSLPRSISMNVPLEMGGLRGAHTKSWDAAMSDLSAEARMLTAALEAFASERDKVREDAVQAGSRLSSTFQLSDKRTSSTSMIELPPLRKGDIMIDPLPISKEKEAVLTRTRPSWLPPKSQKEERRHLKEYARMMASVKEAEKKKGERVQRELEKRDREMGSLNRIWEQHVLPRWDRCINEPRTRELWWRGVSPRSRGDVWALAVGNDLGLSEKSFEAALERAKECERRLLAMEEDRREQEREWRWFEDIQRDVASAFPELKIFQSDGGPLHDAFVEVLMAYAFYRGDVGYVPGVHYLVALLLLNTSTSQAFITLANILNRPIPSAYLSATASSSTKAAAATLDPIHTLVLNTLAIKLPSLHTHLTSPSLALEPGAYLDSMLSTLFCAPAFGLDIASRVMDVYVFEGDKTLVRAAVAVLACLEGRLYSSGDEILRVMEGGGENGKWELGSEEEFMVCVRDMGKVEGESPK